MDSITICAFDLAIIGGGPGGIAPLLSAHHEGTLDELLKLGVVVIEQSSRLGGGRLSDYAINSDSSGRTFADCLRGCGEQTHLNALADHPITRQLERAGDEAVSLRQAADFLDLVGDALRRMIEEVPNCDVVLGTTAVSAHQTAMGWRITLRDPVHGTNREIVARNLIIATGAHQPLDRLQAETFDGFCLQGPIGEGRVLQSGDILEMGGLQRVDRMLAGKTNPRVAVVGGSTSAAAVAHALLHRLPSVAFGEEGVALLHRRPLRVYYPDVAAAAAEGYLEWGEGDICPVSGKVFRFAGFRLDSRELIMQARGLGGRPPEARLLLHQIGTDPTAAQALIDNADLVVLALGYRPRGLPLYGQDGQRIGLLAETGPQMPMVDGQCHVLDGDGEPIPNVFGIGLAAGFVPSGPLGGEPSFRGQANGLWLWQHDVGALIVNAVLPQSEPATANGAAAQRPRHAGRVFEITH